MVDVGRIVALMAAKDPQAVVEIRALADQLYALANHIESGAEGWQSTGGMGDKVRISVVGPDGNVRETKET